MADGRIIASVNKPVVYFELFHLQITVRKKPYPTQPVQCPQPIKEKTMTNRSRLALLSLVLITVIGVALAQTQNPETSQNKDQAKDSAPDINGVWTGTWGVYNPAQGTTPPRDICKKLDAKVSGKENVWEAIFEGDCGRPYKYTI